MLIDEQKQLELHQCRPGHSEEMSDIHISFWTSLQMKEAEKFVPV